MTRQERRAAAAELRARAAKWPEQLVPVPESEWPPFPSPPFAVWRSRHYLVQLYEAPSFEGGRVVRMSVCRCEFGMDGRWVDGIPWDDLQRCKREAGFGDWYAVEVYPPESAVVNVANMRHLWLLEKPLPIGF